MHKALAVFNFDYWTLLTYKSVCYCVNLNCMHSRRVINC